MVMNKQTYENLKLKVKPINQDLEVIQEASDSAISVRDQKL
jgi:translation elongation factor P/translation initiation factor 5A